MKPRGGGATGVQNVSTKIGFRFLNYIQDNRGQSIQKTRAGDSVGPTKHKVKGSVTYPILNYVITF